MVRNNKYIIIRVCNPADFFFRGIFAVNSRKRFKQTFICENKDAIRIIYLVMLNELIIVHFKVI